MLFTMKVTEARDCGAGGRGAWGVRQAGDAAAPAVRRVGERVQDQAIFFTAAPNFHGTQYAGTAWRFTIWLINGLPADPACAGQGRRGHPHLAPKDAVAKGRLGEIVDVDAWHRMVLVGPACLSAAERMTIVNKLTGTTRVATAAGSPDLDF